MPAPSISSGNITIFCQASAPVNWTKLTIYDDYALRIVSGTATVAGSTAFSTCFTPKTLSSGLTFTFTIGAYTLSTSEISAHSHSNGGGQAASPVNAYVLPTGSLVYFDAGPQQVAPSGGGGSHSHTVPAGGSSPVTFATTQDLALQYVDVIQCQRN